MRNAEKSVAILIVALAAWAMVLWIAPRFDGSQANRILRVELGSGAAELTQAISGTNREGVENNVRMVLRSTYLDYVFILLYWLAFMSMAVLAGRMGKKFLGVCVAVFISAAAVSDVLENDAILTAMQLRPFTDAVAVDISVFSEWKWTFFFLASVFLGLAIALNRRVSTTRRLSGWLFIASGVFGLLGIMRYRVALEYSFWMINIGMLLVTVAMLITLWKVYHSLKDLDHVEHRERVHAHA